MTRQEDRLLVQTQLGVNLVVEAGAGTGKTTLLIERLCLCVLAQGTPVEKLVALTFTDKAAAEIKSRFVAKLQQLLQLLHSDETEETLCQKNDTLQRLLKHFRVKKEDLITRAETTLARLDRAAIGTIHSFCADILKAFPLEAGLAPNAQIDTGQKARQLFEIRWNRFLDQELGLSATRAAQWKRVLAEISLPQLKAFAQELSRLTPVEYNYFSHAEKLADFFLRKADRAQQLYAFYAPEGKKPRALEKALSWAALSLQRTASFLRNTPLPPVPNDPPALPSAGYKDWDAQDTDEAKAIVQLAQAVTPEKQTVFLEAYQLVHTLAQEVHTYCQEAGILSFDDLIIKTRNLLQQNLYVRRLLKEKTEALFIDEFQDTDPLQGELLFFLCEKKTGTAATWKEVELEPGKLFVVGDPKQSIYRFRGADITAYEQFTGLMLKQGGHKCFLRRNFRSQPDIIEATNQICSRAMVQETSFQPAYEPIFTPLSASGPAVEWLFIRPDPAAPAQADDFRQNQAEQMARWITENVGKLTLADGRKLCLQDIAVLMRAGTTLSIYTDALRRHGIAFNTETDKDFFRKQEINDLLLLLRAIADPEDKIALAGVLRSPLGGLTDDELFQLGRQHFSAEAVEASAKAAPCFQLIKRFSQLSGRLSLQMLVQKLLDETFLPEACAAAYDGERTLAYLHQFAAWAAQYETENDTPLLPFLAELQRRLAENPEDLTLPPATEAKEAVSLLTVHKAKGLEFPVVLLADLSRKELAGASRPPTHLFSWQYGMYGLRAGKISDVNLSFLEEEQKKHSRCEEIRILYVALTRAKEKLILVADGRTSAGKSVTPFAAAGLFPDGEADTLTSPDKQLTLPVNHHLYLQPKTFKYNQAAAKQTETNLSEPALTAWQQQYASRSQAYQSLRQQTVSFAPSEGNTPLFGQAQQQGAELGSICHRALEILLTASATDVSSACAQAARLCAAPDRQAEAAALVAPFVKSDFFQSLLLCKLIACEMPFSRLLADGNTQNGIMDAVVETQDGEIWIVDYKTDSIAPGQEQETLTQKYQSQLESYRQAAQQIFPQKPVRCFAVFIRTFAAAEL